MQQLAHYQIKNLLGQGTFASVYRAFDQKFEREVALKILKPVWLSDPEAVGRFKQEAKTMAKLRHPHIVDVYDVGESGGSIYLAQLLVEGETLAARLKRGPLAWSKMLEVLRAVAAALDYAHEQGVVHRDIKPSNIMLDQDGRAYLGDFGLVRAAEGSMVLSTTSGGMIGTPAYMAPEQWEGHAVTGATDVYSLGCVIVEMLTGQMLFDGSTPAVVMRQHLISGPELPAEWPMGVPEGVSEILRRGLAENPAERIGRAGELATALAALSTSPRPAVVEGRAEAERLAAERAEAERRAAEKAAVERLAAEKAEAERKAAERAEAERLAVEKAAAERRIAERVEADRLAIATMAEDETQPATRRPVTPVPTKPVTLPEWPESKTRRPTTLPEWS